MDLEEGGILDLAGGCTPGLVVVVTLDPVAGCILDPVVGCIRGQVVGCILDQVVGCIPDQVVGCIRGQVVDYMLDLVAGFTWGHVQILIVLTHHHLMCSCNILKCMDIIMR